MAQGRGLGTDIRANRSVSGNFETAPHSLFITAENLLVYNPRSLKAVRYNVLPFVLGDHFWH